MARNRPTVPTVIREQLAEESGRKCANPGCANVLFDLHHIQEWHIYETHDAEHMVAICPTCHGHVHRGKLRISDEMLYEWKRIVRPSATSWGHVLIEPGETTDVTIGSNVIRVYDSSAAFILSDDNYLYFTVKDGDLLNVSAKMTSHRGEEIIRIVDNGVKYAKLPTTELQSYPGRFLVTIPYPDAYQVLPRWAFWPAELIYSDQGDPNDPRNNPRYRVLDVRVTRPGCVSIQGCWASDEVCIVAHERFLAIETPNQHPLTIIRRSVSNGLSLISLGSVTNTGDSFSAILRIDMREDPSDAA